MRGTFNEMDNDTYVRRDNDDEDAYDATLVPELIAGPLDVLPDHWRHYEEVFINEGRSIEISLPTSCRV